MNTKEIDELLEKLKKHSLDNYEHSIRVEALCASFGKQLKLSDKELSTLKMAGLLHDIGKIEVPSEILNKPSSLTNEEYNIIKKHPEEGKELLSKIGVDKDVIDLVYSHHERVDGNGYPRKLKNEEIPKLAQILIICDCYDAMATDRSYQSKKDLEYIKNELFDNVGKQFDGEYVDKFFEYLEKRK